MAAGQVARLCMCATFLPAETDKTPSPPPHFPELERRGMEDLLVPVLTVLTSAVMATVIAVIVTRFSSKHTQVKG